MSFLRKVASNLVLEDSDEMVIHHWSNHQAEHDRNRETTDDRDRQRLQHLRARTQGQRQRKHSTNGGDGRHQDGPPAPLGCVQHGLASVHSAGTQLLVRVEQQNAVLGHDPDDHDEAHEAALH